MYTAALSVHRPLHRSFHPPTVAASSSSSSPRQLIVVSAGRQRRRCTRLLHNHNNDNSAVLCSSSSSSSRCSYKYSCWSRRQRHLVQHLPARSFAPPLPTTYTLRRRRDASLASLASLASPASPASHGTFTTAAASSRSATVVAAAQGTSGDSASSESSSAPGGVEEEGTCPDDVDDAMASSTSDASPSPGGGYYRWPALHGSTLVFVCEDDLYSVPLEGVRVTLLSPTRNSLSHSLAATVIGPHRITHTYTYNPSTHPWILSSFIHASWTGLPPYAHTHSLYLHAHER